MARAYPLADREPGYVLRTGTGMYLDTDYEIYRCNDGEFIGSFHVDRHNPEHWRFVPSQWLLEQEEFVQMVIDRLVKIEVGRYLWDFV